MSKRERIQERLNDLYAKRELAKDALLKNPENSRNQVSFAERDAAYRATLDMIYIIDPERAYTSIEHARSEYETVLAK